MPSQGKKGAGSSKNAKSAGDDEGSFIVFTNAKDDPKSKKKSKNDQPSSSTSKGSGKGPSASTGPNATNPSATAAGSEEAVKKPDTRKLIGGASWTGKLPVNLLSEHCQRQKWDKPEYSMHKTAEGFVSAVTLRSVHPKTREARTLPAFRLPASHRHLAAQASALEARHFAAAYALFRVSSMKNMHMTLPPAYRDLWKGDFADLKRADEADGRAWMYEADPFAAQEERDAAQAQAAKRREKVALERAKEAARPAGPGARAPTGDKNAMRGWTNVPKVEMGRKVRAQVEDLVRLRTSWNSHGVRLSEAQRKGMAEAVEKLGFRRAHVEEAMDECKDRQEVIEWLLVHVPEDDLPPWSLPEGYSAGLSMASSDLKREAVLKRLAEAGYPSVVCEQFLTKHNGQESEAMEDLQNQLVLGNDVTDDLGELSLGPSGSSDDTWPEEMDTLKAIYDNQFRQLSKTHCTVMVKLEAINKAFVLHVRKSKRYPQSPPIIGLVGDLPAYIRLSAYRQVLQYAKESLLGEPMIFNIVEWLQTDVPRIIENPGKLKDVAALTAPNDLESTKAKAEKSQRRHRRPRALNLTPGTPASLAMQKKMHARQNDPSQQKMILIRQGLPAWQQRERLVKTVRDHQVTIISGETGSGKSTQSVQFILDDMINRELGEAVNIICTQPRRISALGLADRVSEERCSIVGEEVGYTIRGESKQTKDVTKITFVTTGVLLRRLQTSGGTTEDVVASLADVSHVVVDEVHERSLDTDFLLILLRDVLKRRKDLKVILMSATLDAAIFENYFRASGKVGKVEISGRTYPVEDLYLDDVLEVAAFQPKGGSGSWRDEENEIETEGREKSMAGKIQSLGMRINYDLIAATVKAIDAELGAVEGGILIFLPGTAEINRTVEALRSHSEFHALPLHASLTPVEQRRVFPRAPKGKRKVIASTNVAETSITIEDIVAVIDTGKVKETSFDPVNSMVKLEEVWASRAACKQRRGRAGRVRAGKCYKLYTKNMESKMAERPDPEILRVPLEQLCLSVRAMGIKDISSFLAGSLTPPEVSAVDGAISLLERMGALDDGELTALGRHLSLIPADLRCAKLMVYGALFGCLEACVTVAAILTVRSPFNAPQNKREESKAARSSFSKGQGDLVSDLEAYEQWAEMRRSSSARDVRSWCDEKFLSTQPLFDISSNRTQYLSSLKEVGFLPTGYHGSDVSPLNANNTNHALVRALIAGAFHPQTAKIELPDTKYAASISGAVALDPEARTIKYFAEGTGRVFVHPSSTLFDAQGFAGNSVYMSYFSKIATSKVFIRDLTPFNAYTLLMFGGHIALDTLGRGLVVDGWLRLRGWARIGVLVSRLRAMLDDLLAANMEDPAGAETMARSDVVALVRRLVELDGLDR